MLCHLFSTIWWNGFSSHGLQRDDACNQKVHIRNELPYILAHIIIIKAII